MSSCMCSAWHSAWHKALNLSIIFVVLDLLVKLQASEHTNNNKKHVNDQWTHGL